MAGPSHVNAYRVAFSDHARGLVVAWVAGWVFVCFRPRKDQLLVSNFRGIVYNEYIRFSRTLRTALVLAACAFKSPSVEQGIAHMAGSAHPLRNRLVGDLSASGGRSYGERLEVQCRIPYRGSRRPRCGDCASGNSSAFSFVLLLLGLLGGEARALLAPIMLAVAADLVRTEHGLAMMARTVYSDTDLLLHAFGVWLDRGGPFARLQGQAVLGE